MINKKVVGACFLILFLLCAGAYFYWSDVNEMSSQVARLKLERNGYVLGKALTKEQIHIALNNPVDAPIPGTYKFKDDKLFVVADKSNHRVLVIYEQVEQATQKQVQHLIGDLFLTFEEPTVSAHEKVVFWAYSKDGKISAQRFETAKKDKKKLEILATVKCVSDISFMENSKRDSHGHFYYIISSDPMLQPFKDKEKTL